MTNQEIEIAAINADGGTESRPLNQQVVSEYAEIYQADASRLPPPDVFFDGQTYWLADGFHRLAAAKLAGLQRLKLNVHEGKRIDALTHSLGSNAEHGYRRTAADKRYAVNKALTEFPRSSDRHIAKMCRVSPNLVGAVRKENQGPTAQKDSSTATPEEKRLGADNKLRRLPHRHKDEEVACEDGAAESSPSEPGTPPEVTPAPVLEALPAPEAPSAQDGQTDTVELALCSLERACERVASLAQDILAEHPRTASKVRSSLNNLRAQLDQIVKGSLPKKEALESAA